MPTSLFAAAFIFLTMPLALHAADDTSKPTRIGLIGLDTSHVTAFTSLFNDPKAADELAGFRVVAGFPGGTDIGPSRDRVAKFTAELQGKGVEIVDSIPALLAKVDVVLLESVDGRPHLEQVKPVLAAKKSVFIDKPVAGSLADTLAIYDLAKQHDVPCFSSSSLRFGPTIQQVKSNPKLGEVAGCATWGPCSLEPSVPDMFFYGIHGIEALYTVLGTGCQTVTRTATKDTDEIVGVWQDGRIGTYRGIRKNAQEFGGTVFGTKGIITEKFEAGYKPLCIEIAKFFRTGKPPVSAAETIEIVAFMEAADESKRQNGKPVTIAEVLAKARKQ